MPFIADEEIQKNQEKLDFEKKIEKIKESHKVTETVQKQEKASHVTTDSDYIKLVSNSKNLTKEPKEPTPAEIASAIKLHEMIEKKKNEEIKRLLNDKEIGEIKNELIGVLALPMTIQERRELFHHKLKQSQTVNDYLNENVLFRWFNQANHHVKFSAIYGIKYLQTLSEYQQYQQRKTAIIQAKAQQAKTETKSEKGSVKSSDSESESVKSSDSESESE